MASGGSDGIVRSVISKEMKCEDIDPEDIPEDLHVDPSNVQQVLKSNRYFLCKAFASFNTHDDPSGRGHTKSWKSAHAWCTIDLKRQRIAHRWFQKCNQCEGKSEPWFDKQALEKMAKRAVKLYLINIGRLKKRKKTDDGDDANPQIGPPHEETRCAMCQQLGRSCWKKYTKNTAAVQDEDDQDSYDDYEQDEDGPDSYDDDYADEDNQYYDQYEEGYGYNEDDYDPYQDYDYEDTYDYDDTNDDYPYSD